MIFNYFIFQWEPGFNGGFDQEFIYRVREVSFFYIFKCFFL